MTVDPSKLYPDVKGGNGAEQRFIRDHAHYHKEPSTLEKLGEMMPNYNEHKVKKPGYLERQRDKIRADIEAGKRHAWSLVSTQPFADVNKQRYTYRVKDGELKVTDKDGKVIHSVKDERLQRYEGVTLRGEVTGRGPVEMKGGLISRAKLSREEGHFAGVRDRIKTEKARIVEATKASFSAAMDGVVKAPSTGYKKGKVALKEGYGKAKAAAVSGTQKGKVLIKKYRDGEGLFSFKESNAKQDEGADNPLEVGQFRG
ncbi:MAG: hypothetical protein AAGA75_08920 [Cyanobacteria bacterium P01_E01_bin.6]